MNIKAWLEQTGLKAYPVALMKAEKLPYLAFYDRLTMRGADLKNNIAEHDLTVEHYSERENDSSKAALEALLSQAQHSFQKSETFLSANAIFCTIYNLTILEGLE